MLSEFNFRRVKKVSHTIYRKREGVRFDMGEGPCQRRVLQSKDWLLLQMKKRITDFSRVVITSHLCFNGTGLMLSGGYTYGERVRKWGCYWRTKVAVRVWEMGAWTSCMEYCLKWTLAWPGWGTLSSAWARWARRPWQGSLPPLPFKGSLPFDPSSWQSRTLVSTAPLHKYFHF